MAETKVVIRGEDQVTEVLQKTDAETKKLGDSLNRAAREAGLSAEDMTKLGLSFGSLTERQVQVSAKAKELAEAVKNGKMSAEEAGKAFKEYTNSLGGIPPAVDKSEKSVNAFAGTYMEMMAKIEAGKFVLETFAGVFEKAFEMGREGATIVQVNSSFNSLMDSVGAAPDTLQLLMDATKNTVDDEEIMGATLRMVAGTSADLTRELIAVSPQIMEMAKAANKLNPTMGTTIEQYERLIQGIRTGSERMLRQSGVMVNFQAAYESYADSIGKTVDELSEEERVSANLAAVLSQQSTLIKQVGGDTDSAVDSFDQMNVALGEIKDTLLVELTPALTSAATAAATLVTGAEKISSAMDKHSKDMLIASESASEYNREMALSSQRLENFIRLVAIVTMNPMLETFLDRVLGLNKKLSDSEFELAKSMAISADNAKKQGEIMAKLHPELTTTTEETKKLTAAEIMATDAFKLAAKEADNARDMAIKRAAESRKLVEQEMEQAKRAADEFIKETQRMSAALDDMKRSAVEVGTSFTLTQNISDYMIIVNRAVEENKALTAQYNQMAWSGIPATSQAMMDLTAKIQANNQAQVDARDNMQKTTLQMIYQQASQGLGAEESLAMARAFGMIDEQSFAVASAIQKLRAQFDANRDGMISAGEGADQYTQSIIRLQAKITELMALGLPVTGTALAGFAPSGYPAPAGQNAVTNAAGGAIIIQYSPVLSTASAYELEQALTPIVQSIYRKMGR